MGGIRSNEISMGPRCVPLDAHITTRRRFYANRRSSGNFLRIPTVNMKDLTDFVADRFEEMGITTGDEMFKFLDSMKLDMIEKGQLVEYPTCHGIISMIHKG